MVNKANTGVLVDEPTALDDKCRAELDFNPLDPITVKGRDEPLPVYEPLGRRGARRGTTNETATVRLRERMKVREALEAVQLRRSGGLVVVEGEAGIGKSALLREAEALATTTYNIRVLKASCSAIETAAYYAFGFVVRELLDAGAAPSCPGRRVSTQSEQRRRRMARCPSLSATATTLAAARPRQAAAPAAVLPLA